MSSHNERADLNRIVMDVEDGSSTEDNDSHKKTKRSSKTTPLQYQKLQEFMQTHMDFTRGKADDSQTLAWEELSAELNQIGPPFHSSIDWRRVWTDFKANQKRKGHEAMTVQSKTAVKHSNTSSNCLENKKQDDHLDSFLSAIFDEIEKVEDKVNTLEVKIDTVIAQHKEINQLLKEVIDLLKPQSLYDENVV